MKTKTLLLLISLLFCGRIIAQNGVADSIDALHYDLQLDIGNLHNRQISGSAAVTMRILRHVDSLALELCPSTIDSVLVDGISVPFNYDQQHRLLTTHFGGSVGDTVTMTVFYRKGQHVMPQEWGGFYFDDNIYYNLGIAIYEYPHNAGKAWFPCRDNFTDKATYSLRITAKPGWRAICSGVKTGEVEYADGSLMTAWNLNHPTPTYLVGVAVAPFHIIERVYESEYATYPAILGFIGHDSTNVWRTYEHMSKVIPMFERCFGPYRWDRVGYVSTTRGSMEHVANIAFTTNCMSSQQEPCLATMSHEFAHSWFGNLITCTTSKDMWINEGGASFCEEVAIQAITQDEDSLHYRDYARHNLRNVLLTTHLSDGGFKPLYGQTPQYTYGSTVYNKGATVWHSLRGYMGDELFYSSLRRLFESAAFKNLDSWQLRDSLSAYSGIDLTDFFDFHVFRPGFVDYVIDSLEQSANSTTIHLRQKLYGTDTMMDGNRVWVTFFSQNMESEKRLVTFDGESTAATFQLPFEPAFAIVDFDEELSKAALAQQTTIKTKGSVVMDDALCRIDTRKVVDGDSAWLHVTHHWSNPDTSLSPQILKMADRYWTVEGRIPDGFLMSGMFYYSRMGDDYTLDDNLITSTSDFGILRLMYRRDASENWRVATSRHTDDISQGYFVNTSLKLGEYTLALIDTSYVSIEVPVDGSFLDICPNPSNGRVVVKSSIGSTVKQYDDSFILEVINPAGQLVKRFSEVGCGKEIELGLPAGFYVVKVLNPQGKLLVSKKIQIF